MLNSKHRRGQSDVTDLSINGGLDRVSQGPALARNSISKLIGQAADKGLGLHGVRKPVVYSISVSSLQARE